MDQVNYISSRYYLTYIPTCNFYIVDISYVKDVRLVRAFDYKMYEILILYYPGKPKIFLRWNIKKFKLAPKVSKI